MSIAPVSYSLNRKNIAFRNLNVQPTPSMLYGVGQDNKVVTSSLKQLRSQLHLSGFDYQRYFDNLYQRCKSNLVKGTNTIN